MSEKENNKSPIPMYYWDKKKNFGDLIGPWLVTLMTGRSTYNVKGRSREPALAAVGSLLTMIERPGLTIWGPGSIGAIPKESIQRLKSSQPESITAVRGWLSHKELTTKLGWSVPKVYGDPAILLPRFFTPKGADSSGRIAICPHFSQKGFFQSLDEEKFDVIDVATDPWDVVTSIAKAPVCISTSLHGIIVAQAYGVPWVWLSVSGKKLGGNHFKFEDFFTVIDREAVSEVAIPSTNITPEAMNYVARLATLPKPKFTFDELLDAFPLSRT